MILEVIGYWLEQHSSHDCCGMSRQDLRSWLEKKQFNGDTLSVVDVCDVQDVDLVIDALIAAGIGEGVAAGHVVCDCYYYES